MIQANYEQLAERIAKLSNLSVDEIKRRVEAKKAKLSGLITSEGAARIVAAELGISFDKQKFKIKELLMGMKKITVKCKIVEINPIKRYRRAEHEGELATMLVADDTSSVRVVLWDTKHIDMIKSNLIKKDDVIEIKNADVRGTTASELHLSGTSDLEKLGEAMEKVNIEMPKQVTTNISNLRANELATTKATVVQMFQPAFFDTCPECNMKVSYENEKAICIRHGPIAPKRKILMSLVLDDGTENIRALLFNESATKLFKINENEIENFKEASFFLEKKNQMLGSELVFNGRTRKNVLFDRTEFIVNEASEIPVDEMIKDLSKSS